MTTEKMESACNRATELSASILGFLEREQAKDIRGVLVRARYHVSMAAEAFKMLWLHESILSWWTAEHDGGELLADAREHLTKCIGHLKCTPHTGFIQAAEALLAAVSL